MQVSKESDQKSGLYCVNEKKLTKILKGPFSQNFLQIFLIFVRVIPFNDTNNLCRFQKNWIKNVDFIV